METKPLMVESLLNAPISKVWQALTSNADMQQWYFKLNSFEPVVGFEFSFSGEGNGGEKYIHNCRITQVVPQKKLSYTWTYEGLDGQSEVNFELFTQGDNATLVRITHTGLDSLDKNGSDFAISSFTKGWTYILGTSLKTFVEKNEL